MRPTKDELNYKARRRYYDSHFSNIPTLDDLREATAISTDSLIRQIVNGQAVYYGYEVEWEPENAIKGVTKESDAKMVANITASNKAHCEKVRVKRLHKTLEEKINDFFGGKLTLAELEEKKKTLGL